MKKIAFCFLFICLSFVSFGQTEKGNILLGGTIDLTSTGAGSGSNRQTAFNVLPQVGFFTIDNLALGLGIGIRHTSLSNSSLTAYGILPFVRYYFLDGKIKPFLQAQGGYVGSTSSQNNFSSTSSGYGLSGAAGAAFFVSKTVGLDLSLGYGMTDQSSNGFSSSVNNFGLNVGFLVYLGK